MITRILFLVYTCLFFMLVNQFDLKGQCPDTVVLPIDQVTTSQSTNQCETWSVDLSTWIAGVQANTATSTFTTQLELQEQSLILTDAQIDDFVIADFIDPDACELQLLHFELTLICVDDPTVTLPGGVLEISVYPIPNINQDFLVPSVNACEFVITDNCPDADLLITYFIDGDDTTTPPENLMPGETLAQSYTVYFPGADTINAEGSCGVTDNPVITCPGANCPTLVLNPLATPFPIDQCQNDFIDLGPLTSSVTTNFDTEAVFTWRYSNGDEILNPSEAVSNLSGICGATPDTFFLEIDCITDSELNLDGGFLPLIVFPDLDVSVINLPDDCATEITPNCINGNNLLIEYSTDGITFSETPPPPPAVGNELTVFYKISLMNNGICTNLEFANSFTAVCPDPTGCVPVVSSFLDKPPYVVYNNVIINLGNLVTGTDGGISTNLDLEDLVLIWLDKDGQQLVNAGSTTLSLDHFGMSNCEVDTQVITLEVACIDNPGVSVFAGTQEFYLYPEIIPDLTYTLPNNCEPSISTICPDELTIEYSTDGGNTYSTTPPPDLVLGDPPLVLDYQIYWTENTNSLIQEQVTVFCENCPDVSTMPLNSVLCNNGVTADLNDLQNDPDPTIGNWAITGTPDGSNPAQLNGTIFDPTGADAGTYTVAFFNPLPGCTDTTFQTIEVGAGALAGIGSNESICTDNITIIQLNDYLSGDYTTGIWDETSATASTGSAFDAVNGTFDPSNQDVGLYTFQHRVGNNCGSDTAFVEINLLEGQSDILTPSTIVCNGGAGSTFANFNELLLVDTLTGTWTNLDNAPIDLSNLNAVDFNGVPLGQYGFSFATDSGCPSTTTVLVQDCSVQIILPTAFSPNQDGPHELFQILNPTLLEGQDINFRIYNRWGQLVFSTNDANIGWDGTFKKKAQPMGVYLFFVELDGAVVTQGNVTLIR